MNIESLYGLSDKEYTQTFFGKNALRVPMNFVVQQQGTTTTGLPIILFVGQSTCPAGEQHPLAFNSKKTHQLVLSEAIIIPKLVIDSDAFQGQGISGLVKMNPDEWLENPHGVLIGPK